MVSGPKHGVRDSGSGFLQPPYQSPSPKVIPWASGNSFE